MKFLMAWCWPVWLALSAEAGVVPFTMNEIRVEVDESSGAILRIATPAAGPVVETTMPRAGLLTLGYPVRAFAPLQLEARYSTAVLTRQPDELTISWDKLGASRSVPLPAGQVSAQVRIRAAPDGKSIILTCHIDNQSTGQIYQVCFPDLQGVRPFAGEQQTLVGGQKLFAGPVIPEDRDPKYAMSLWKMLGRLRGIELRGATAGLAIAQKTWVQSRVPNLMCHRDQADSSWMRLLWRHKTPIDPGQTWDSGEFWVTRIP